MFFVAFQAWTQSGAVFLDLLPNAFLILTPMLAFCKDYHVGWV